MQRVALAACPPEDRTWIRAMFAEMDVVEGPWSRLTWIMGALQFAASRNLERGPAVLGRRLWVAIGFALCASVISAVFSRAGYESFGVDDDLFLGLAVSFATLSLGLLLVARAASVRSPPLRGA